MVFFPFFLYRQLKNKHVRCHRCRCGANVDFSDGSGGGGNATNTGHQKRKTKTGDARPDGISFFCFSFKCFVTSTQPIAGRRHFLSITTLLVRWPISDDYRVDSHSPVKRHLIIKIELALVSCWWNRCIQKRFAIDSMMILVQRTPKTKTLSVSVFESSVCHIFVAATPPSYASSKTKKSRKQKSPKYSK